MAEEVFVDSPNKTLTVTDSNLDEAIAKYPFIIVDCWAEWCGPCKMLGPIIENLAKKHQGSIVFAKLDVDSNPQTSSKHGIRSIPNLLIFKDGKKVGDIVGAMPEDKLMERINAFK
ncbi:MAG TPA: thioredoxin [Deltaproteobacteria bacterium]|nr:thioredoxin [Deltaproteobacteria bacterium]